MASTAMLAALTQRLIELGSDPKPQDITNLITWLEQDNLTALSPHLEAELEQIIAEPATPVSVTQTHPS
ncbi:Hypothetical protein POVN_LOCUS598 [uncultured virus]|nr:Hypothetical protein POVN_LOCUS598 [uncultured virus]